MKTHTAVEQIDVDRKGAQFILFGGAAGVIGILGYLAGIAIDFGGPAPSLLAVGLFCILTIVANLALRDAIANGGRSRSADIGLLLSLPAFGTLLSMIAVQLAVRSHAKSILDAAVGDQKETFLQAVLLARQIDWGLDVAWDLMGAAYLLAFGVAMCSSRRFGVLWGLPLVVLSVALIVLNTMTFPLPPASAGLFDLGPFVGLYMLAMNVRLIAIGAQMLRRPEMRAVAAPAPAA